MLEMKYYPAIMSIARLLFIITLFITSAGAQPTSENTSYALKNQTLDICFSRFVQSNDQIAIDEPILMLANRVEMIKGVGPIWLQRGAEVSSIISLRPAGAFMRPGVISVLPKSISAPDSTAYWPLAGSDGRNVLASVYKGESSLTHKLLAIPSLRIFGKGDEAVLIPGELFPVNTVRINLAEGYIGTDDRLEKQPQWDTLPRTAGWGYALVPGLRQKKCGDSGWYFHSCSFVAGAAMAVWANNQVNSDIEKMNRASLRSEWNEFHEDYENHNAWYRRFISYTAIVYICQLLDALIYPGYERAIESVREDTSKRGRFWLEMKPLLFDEQHGSVVGVSSSF